MDSLRPVSAKLLSPLGAVFRDAQRRETERSLATDVLADFAAARPEILAELLLDADEKQFAVLFPKLSDFGERVSLLLALEISKELPRAAPEDDKEKLAKRQANAAAALLRLGRPESVWSLLKHGPDPRRRIYLIHRLGPLGVLRQALLGRLAEETDATIRRALVLSLGEFDERNWLITERNAVVEQVQRLYRTADDPGVHGAAEWLLRHWKQDAWLKQMEQEWAKDEVHASRSSNASAKNWCRAKRKRSRNGTLTGRGKRW